MSQSILVVDDTLVLLDLVRDLLTEEGYDVATCLMSREAYARAREIRPDLVVLDVVMPEMSGWDVLALLRGDPELGRVPIVICTAWAEEAVARMVELREPNLWLLPKPFETSDLFDTVEEALTSASGGHAPPTAT